MTIRKPFVSVELSMIAAPRCAQLLVLRLANAYIAPIPDNRKLLCGGRKDRRAGDGFILEMVLSGQHLLESLISPAVEAAGYRLVRLRIMGGQTKTVQIMAERPDGQMDVEDCATLSRTLSEMLDAADPIAAEYVLEVSSPGIDRPLTRLEDYERFSGYEARVEVVSPLDGRRRFKGLLLGVNGNDVVMEIGGDRGVQRIRLPFSSIADGKLILTDRLIQESLKARELREQQRSSH
jgi:ribosome maturation factor RimP